MDNVLLVDDDAAVLNVLERVLAPRYRIYTALSAPEAEKLLERVDVKVVIADGRMSVPSVFPPVRQASRFKRHHERTGDAIFRCDARWPARGTPHPLRVTRTAR